LKVESYAPARHTPGAWNTATAKKPLPCAQASWLTARDNVDLGIWNKLTKLIIFLSSRRLCSNRTLVLAVDSAERADAERNLALDNEIKKEEENHKRLKADVEALRDPRTVERLAREKLNFARPNENGHSF